MTSCAVSFGGSLGDGEVTLVEPNSLNLGSVDWQALELKFAELNALRNAPRSGLNASRARQKQRGQVSQAIESLLEMAQAACRRMLVEGDAKEAIEGGLKTLKLKEQYYSTGSLKLVSAYFHLARVNQYMDRYKAAEEFLSLAQWTILKHPECDTTLKAELHQTYGLLYASDGRLDIALKQLAQATYFLTELHGPEHVLTSFGYFDLGNVFAAKANMECAMSLYDKVKDIWYSHLTACFQCQPFDAQPRPPSLLSPEQLGEENLQDTLKMLRGIVGLQTERFTQVHPCTGKAELVLGLFNVWIADSAAAQEGLGKALEIHKRVYSDGHPTVTAIRSYMDQFKYPVPDYTEHLLDSEKSDEAEAAAATKIQALQRGRQTRKQQAAKQTQQERAEGSEATKESTAAGTNPAAAAVATPTAASAEGGGADADTGGSGAAGASPPPPPPPPQDAEEEGTPPPAASATEEQAAGEGSVAAPETAEASQAEVAAAAAAADAEAVVAEDAAAAVETPAAEEASATEEAATATPAAVSPPGTEEPAAPAPEEAAEQAPTAEAGAEAGAAEEEEEEGEKAEATEQAAAAAPEAPQPEAAFEAAEVPAEAGGDAEEEEGAGGEAASAAEAGAVPAEEAGAAATEEAPQQ